MTKEVPPKIEPATGWPILTESNEPIIADMHIVKAIH